jgi:hypothetical protein
VLTDQTDANTCKGGAVVGGSPLKAGVVLTPYRGFHRGTGRFRTVLAVREEGAPESGRLALEITFGSGRVRCDTWSGDLRLANK